MGSRLTAATLSDRIVKAIRISDKLATMLWSRSKKQMMVKVLVLPTALYGCEAAPHAEKLLAGLSVSIAI